MERPIRLGFLASHNGTSFKYTHQAIQNEQLNAEIVAFASNNSKSEAMEFAKEHYRDKSHHISRKTHEDPDSSIAEIMMAQGVDYIVLSGYMRPLAEPLTTLFQDKIINSHPADTEKYGGEGMYGDFVHNAVLEANETHTYPTIHLVNEGIDTGKVLAQGVVEILPNETVESLREKVKPVECELLLGVLQTLPYPASE